LQIVSALPEFPPFRRMLDLGGGPGLIGMAIVAAHPSMTGVVFDLPPVVKVAEKFIKEYEMETRMEVLGGDYAQDDIGNKYDLIWAAECLNFAKQDLDTLMKKIYDALTQNGVFISYADGLTHERTKPEIRIGKPLSSHIGAGFTLRPGFHHRFYASGRIQVRSFKYAGYWLGADGPRHWKEGVMDGLASNQRNHKFKSI
jgi:cyclopropane fatty-acyl-phospholipid synthase-like methyltransferase